MRTKAIAVSVVLVLAGFVPAAGAYHLSVGNYDSAASSEESADNPTVPPGSGEANPNGNLYERALVSNCYESPEDPDGTSADQEVPAAAAADPACGRLLYNDGTQFVEPSPVDQDINIDGWEFDGIHTTYVGAFSLSFSPLTIFGLPGEPVYKTAHDVGSEVGLTDDGETAWEGDQGVQTFSPALLLPNAVKTATQESGAYEGNGWLFPYMDQSMMAFVTDADGQPVSEADLNKKVTKLKEKGQLPDSAVPTLCGFTPDDEITIDAPQIGFCEVAFEYNAEDGDPTDGADFKPDEKEDYNDPCESPTYVCGVNKPGWYAQKVCNPGASEECPTTPGVCQRLPGQAPCVEQLEQGDGFESTRDYDVWHWVVAPSEPQKCPTVQEPGFMTEAPTGADIPYIAHDLDVFVTPTGPAADATGAGELRGTESVESYAVATADNYREGASASQVIDTLPGLPDDVNEAVSQTQAQFAKSDTVEPNAGGDTSQSNIEEPASVNDPCLKLSGVEEDVADPWVDIIDNQVFRDRSGDVAAGPGDAKDLYLNSDEGQDASNRPGPGLYDMGGKVGVFTDRNDDGDYDQVGANDLFKDVQDVGAYPLFWDMRIDEKTGQPDVDAGCSQGFAQKKLTEQMVNAGYGPHTGLIQVLYLNEPTALFHESSGETLTIEQGDTAIVFKSPGLETLRENGDQTVQNAIQDALDKLPSEPSNVVHAIDRVEQASSDFDDQCGQSTGGFSLDWAFLHSAQLASAGDTIVTEYIFENNANSGVIGGGDGDIPPLNIGGNPYAFDQGVNKWFDVDPFDGNADRNTGSGAPPSE